MIMKKLIYSWGLMLAAAFSLTNCAQELDNPVFPEDGNFVLVASTPDVKTVNDGLATKWVEGDKINVFHALGNDTEYVNDGAFTISDVNDGKFTGSIVGDLDPEEEYDWFVLYPYNEKIITPAAQTAGYTYIGYSTGLNQTGYGNMASLKGSVCPLYGVLKYGGVKPVVAMNHLSSVVAINVTNVNDEPLTITTASFTATEDIVGSYFIDLTKTPVTYSASDTKYVKNTATVNVSNGTALAKGESAILYAAIKPFTAPSGEKLTVSVNGYSKDITLPRDVTFTAGQIKTLNFDYDYDATEEPGLPEEADKIIVDFSTMDYANGAAITSVTQMPVTVSFAKGSGSNPPAYYTTGTAVRAYAKNTITVSSALGKVVGVEFVFSTTEKESDNSNGITANTGSLTLPTWTGSEESVTFTVSGDKGHRRIQKLEVYVDTEGEEWEAVQLETPVVRCSDQTENSLTFQWDVIANAIGYEVTFAGKPEIVTGTRYTLMELEPETEYEISVKAVGDGIYYLNSEVVTVLGETTEEVESSGVPTEKSLSFANTSQRTTFTTSQQIWEQNGIKLINDKSASTTNVANYSNPARFYASSKITVEAPGQITKIVFDANSSSYATAMKNSIGTVSGATVSVSSDKVTVTFTTPVDSFVVAKLTAQVRMDSITVTYLE